MSRDIISGTGTVTLFTPNAPEFRHDGLSLFIPGEFVSLNEYIKAARNPRAGSHISNAIKQEETSRVRIAAHGCPMITEYPVNIELTWFTKDERTDPDNTAFSVKSVLDGLVLAGVLQGDTRKHIKRMSHEFTVDKKNPGVEIVISR